MYWIIIFKRICLNASCLYTRYKIEIYLTLFLIILFDLILQNILDINLIQHDVSNDMILTFNACRLFIDSIQVPCQFARPILFLANELALKGKRCKFTIYI